MRTDGRTDSRDEANSRFSQFYERAQKYGNIHTDTAVHVVKTYRESRGITPLILNLGTIMQVSGQFYAPAGFFFSTEKKPGAH